MEKQRRKTTVKVVEKAVIAPDVGKLPPQARELEEAVLGALMLEKDAYSVVSEDVYKRQGLPWRHRSRFSTRSWVWPHRKSYR